MQKALKKNRVSFVFSDRTIAQLAELQRALSFRAGTQLSKTQALETAIDLVLESLAKNKQQARLI